MVGAAAGLFAGTDSVAATVNDEGAVRMVELFHGDAGTRASLRTRLRDRYDHAHHSGSGTDPESVVHVNPITEIRLAGWRGSGARIRLSGHRFR